MEPARSALTDLLGELRQLHDGGALSSLQLNTLRHLALALAQSRGGDDPHPGDAEGDDSSTRAIAALPRRHTRRVRWEAMIARPARSSLTPLRDADRSEPSTDEDDNDDNDDCGSFASARATTSEARNVTRVSDIAGAETVPSSSIPLRGAPSHFADSSSSSRSVNGSMSYSATSTAPDEVDPRYRLLSRTPYASSAPRDRGMSQNDSDIAQAAQSLHAVDGSGSSSSGSVSNNSDSRASLGHGEDEDDEDASDSEGADVADNDKDEDDDDDDDGADGDGGSDVAGDGMGSVDLLRRKLLNSRSDALIFGSSEDEALLPQHGQHRSGHDANEGSEEDLDAAEAVDRRQFRPFSSSHHHPASSTSSIAFSPSLGALGDHEDLEEEDVGDADVVGGRALTPSPSSPSSRSLLLLLQLSVGRAEQHVGLENRVPTDAPAAAALISGSHIPSPSPQSHERQTTAAATADRTPAVVPSKPSPLSGSGSSGSSAHAGVAGATSPPSASSLVGDGGSMLPIASNSSSGDDGSGSGSSNSGCGGGSSSNNSDRGSSPISESRIGGAMGRLMASSANHSYEDMSGGAFDVPDWGSTTAVAGDAFIGTAAVVHSSSGSSSSGNSGNTRVSSSNSKSVCVGQYWPPSLDAGGSSIRPASSSSSSSSTAALSSPSNAADALGSMSEAASTGVVVDHNSSEGDALDVYAYATSDEGGSEHTGPAYGDSGSEQLTHTGHHVTQTEPRSGSSSSSGGGVRPSNASASGESHTSSRISSGGGGGPGSAVAVHAGRAPRWPHLRVTIVQPDETQQHKQLQQQHHVPLQPSSSGTSSNSAQTNTSSGGSMRVTASTPLSAVSSPARTGAGTTLVTSAASVVIAAAVPARSSASTSARAPNISTASRQTVGGGSLTPIQSASLSASLSAAEAAAAVVTAVRGGGLLTASSSPNADEDAVSAASMLVVAPSSASSSFAAAAVTAVAAEQMPHSAALSAPPYRSLNNTTSSNVSSGGGGVRRGAEEARRLHTARKPQQQHHRTTGRGQLSSSSSESHAASTVEGASHAAVQVVGPNHVRRRASGGGSSGSLPFPEHGECSATSAQLQQLQQQVEVVARLPSVAPITACVTYPSARSDDNNNNSSSEPSGGAGAGGDARSISSTRLVSAVSIARHSGANSISSTQRIPTVSIAGHSADVRSVSSTRRVPAVSIAGHSAFDESSRSAGSASTMTGERRSVGTVERDDEEYDVDDDEMDAAGSTALAAASVSAHAGDDSVSAPLTASFSGLVFTAINNGDRRVDARRSLRHFRPRADVDHKNDYAAGDSAAARLPLEAALPDPPHAPLHRPQQQQQRQHFHPLGDYSIAGASSSSSATSALSTMRPTRSPHHRQRSVDHDSQQQQHRHAHRTTHTQAPPQLLYPHRQQQQQHTRRQHRIHTTRDDGAATLGIEPPSAATSAFSAAISAERASQQRFHSTHQQQHPHRTMSSRSHLRGSRSTGTDGSNGIAVPPSLLVATSIPDVGAPCPVPDDATRTAAAAGAPMLLPRGGAAARETSRVMMIVSRDGRSYGGGDAATPFRSTAASGAVATAGADRANFNFAGAAHAGVGGAAPSSLGSPFRGDVLSAAASVALLSAHGRGSNSGSSSGGGSSFASDSNLHHYSTRTHANDSGSSASIASSSAHLHDGSGNNHFNAHGVSSVVVERGDEDDEDEDEDDDYDDECDDSAPISGIGVRDDDDDDAAADAMIIRVTVSGSSGSGARTSRTSSVSSRSSSANSGYSSKPRGAYFEGERGAASITAAAAPLPRLDSYSGSHEHDEVGIHSSVALAGGDENRGTSSSSNRSGSSSVAMVPASSVRVRSRATGLEYPVVNSAADVATSTSSDHRPYGDKHLQLGAHAASSASDRDGDVASDAEEEEEEEEEAYGKEGDANKGREVGSGSSTVAVSRGFLSALPSSLFRGDSALAFNGGGGSGEAVRQGHRGPPQQQQRRSSSGFITASVRGGAPCDVDSPFVERMREEHARVGDAGASDLPRGTLSSPPSPSSTSPHLYRLFATRALDAAHEHDAAAAARSISSALTAISSSAETPTAISTAPFALMASAQSASATGRAAAHRAEALLGESLRRDAAAIATTSSSAAAPRVRVPQRDANNSDDAVEHASVVGLPGYSDSVRSSPVASTAASAAAAAPSSYLSRQVELGAPAYRSRQAYLLSLSGARAGAEEEEGAEVIADEEEYAFIPAHHLHTGNGRFSADNDDGDDDFDEFDDHGDDGGFDDDFGDDDAAFDDAAAAAAEFRGEGEDNDEGVEYEDVEIDVVGDVAYVLKHTSDDDDDGDDDDGDGYFDDVGDDGDDDIDDEVNAAVAAAYAYVDATAADAAATAGAHDSHHASTGDVYASEEEVESASFVDDADASGAATETVPARIPGSPQAVSNSVPSSPPTRQTLPQGINAFPQQQQQTPQPSRTLNSTGVPVSSNSKRRQQQRTLSETRNEVMSRFSRLLSLQPGTHGDGDAREFGAILTDIEEMMAEEGGVGVAKIAARDDNGWHRPVDEMQNELQRLLRDERSSRELRGNAEGEDDGRELRGLNGLTASTISPAEDELPSLEQPQQGQGQHAQHQQQYGPGARITRTTALVRPRSAWRRGEAHPADILDDDDLDDSDDDEDDGAMMMNGSDVHFDASGSFSHRDHVSALSADHHRSQQRPASSLSARVGGTAHSIALAQAQQQLQQRGGLGGARRSAQSASAVSRAARSAVAAAAADVR